MIQRWASHGTEVKMLVAIKKGTASIVFENKKEIEDFQTALEWYMDMVYEDDGEHGPDSLVKKINDKFNPEEK